MKRGGLRKLLPPSLLRRVVVSAIVVDVLSAPWSRIHPQRRWLGEDSLAAVKPVAKLSVVWIGHVMLPECEHSDVMRMRWMCEESDIC